MSSEFRTRLVSVVLLVLVFVTGAIVGAAFDRTLGAEPSSDSERTSEERADRDGDDRDDDDDRPRGIWTRVDPDEAQRERIDAIVGDYRDRMESLQDEFSEAYNPRYWAIVDSTRTLIRDVLTPEQRIRYDSLTAAHDERRRDRNRWD